MCAHVPRLTYSQATSWQRCTFSGSASGGCAMCANRHDATMLICSGLCSCVGDNNELYNYSRSLPFSFCSVLSTDLPLAAMLVRSSASWLRRPCSVAVALWRVRTGRQPETSCPAGSLSGLLNLRASTGQTWSVCACRALPGDSDGEPDPASSHRSSVLQLQTLANRFTCRGCCTAYQEQCSDRRLGAPQARSAEWARCLVGVSEIRQRGVKVADVRSSHGGAIHH